MTEGLTFDKNSVNVTLHKKATNVDETLGTNADYNVEITNLEKQIQNVLSILTLLKHYVIV